MPWWMTTCVESVLEVGLPRVGGPVHYSSGVVAVVPQPWAISVFGGWKHLVSCCCSCRNRWWNHRLGRPWCSWSFWGMVLPVRMMISSMKLLVGSHHQWRGVLHLHRHLQVAEIMMTTCTTTIPLRCCRYYPSAVASVHQSPPRHCSS